MRKKQPEIYRARTNEMERAVLGYIPERQVTQGSVGTDCSCLGENLCLPLQHVAQAIYAEIYAQDGFDAEARNVV